MKKIYVGIVLLLMTLLMFMVPPLLTVADTTTNLIGFVVGVMSLGGIFGCFKRLIKE